MFKKKTDDWMDNRYIKKKQKRPRLKHMYCDKCDRDVCGLGEKCGVCGWKRRSNHLRHY